MPPDHPPTHHPISLQTDSPRSASSERDSITLAAKAQIAK